jgi:D-tyrosyl-tRNA(Tyr) deacylase
MASKKKSRSNAMRAVIQRVSSAEVAVEGRQIGKIGLGFVILLGVGHNDGEAEAKKLWEKTLKLRIFEDENAKANLSLADVKGELLIISQFTLFANCKKGNRPSFTEAGSPDEAKRLYEHFVELARRDVSLVATGEFGAMMDVSLVNDGPFTIILDTDCL